MASPVSRPHPSRPVYIAREAEKAENSPMQVRNRMALVTGADGFIGSHLAEELARRGCRVRAMAQYNSFGTRGWLDTLPPDLSGAMDIRAGDIRDARCVRTLMEGCDLVFHLAALIAIPYSYQAPQSYVETNIGGTLNVLEAARELGTGKILHTSTSEVYGTARSVPIGEEHPLQAQSPYAATKIGADQLALSFHRSFGTPVTVVRPFNTYGPRQSTRAVIPTIIAQIAKGGKVVRLGALHPTRDFNFVKDTVAGFIAAAECEAGLGEVFNLGSDFEISIGDTAALIAEAMGREVEIAEDGQRLRPAASEVERLWADNAKAARVLGWKPAYGSREGLKRGLAETAAWFLEPANLAHYRHSGYAV
jgi:NAD dependent epimerase/dehydratase